MTTRRRTTLAAPNRPLLFARSGRALTDEVAVEKFLQWISWYPDTDETLRRAGITRDKLRALECDDEVTQCLDTRREAMICTPWRLEPNASRAAKWIADAVTPHMDSIRRGAFAAVPYGYSVMEAVYTRRSVPRGVSYISGGLSIDRISEKPFEWFEPKHDGRLIYRPTEGGEIECDPLKFFLTARTPTYRNPYGEALLSRLYWPVFHRSQGWRFWLQFAERFGTPLLIGETQGDPAEMARALYAAVQDAAIAVGAGSKVTSIESGKDGQQFHLLEQAILKRIQKLILGQTLTSDVGDKGSYAAAKVHNDVREDKRNADIRLVTGTVQRIIDTLAELNGLQAPTFCMEDDTGIGMERAQRDVLYVNARSLRLTKDYFLDRTDLKEEHFEIPEPVAPPASDAQGVAASDAAQFAFARRSGDPFTATQMVIERGIDTTLADLHGPTDGAAIKAAILAAQNSEDLEDRLAVLLRDSDARQFNQVMERALFAADVIGYAHAGGQAA